MPRTDTDAKAESKAEPKVEAKPEPKPEKPSNWLQDTLDKVNSLPAQCEPMKALLAEIIAKVDSK